MRSLLTQYVRGKKRTLKYEFAVVLLAVLVAYIARVAFGTDPAWITAQQGVLGAIAIPILTFVGAVVGLQIWQNQQQDGAPPSSAAPAPDYENGSMVAEPTAEERARGA